MIPHLNTRGRLVRLTGSWYLRWVWCSSRSSAWGSSSPSRAPTSAPFLSCVTIPRHVSRVTCHVTRD